MTGLAKLMALATVTLSIASGAWAQDEMPKGLEAAPSKKTPSPGPVPAPAAPAAPAGDQSAPPPGTMTDEPAAVLQALDKVTARIRRITVKTGQSADFGTLSVRLDACRKAPPEDPPESAAFLEIADRNSSGQGAAATHIVFSGWMFASSPALSAMDHPVYDISVVDCASEASTTAGASEPSPPGSPGAASSGR